MTQHTAGPWIIKPDYSQENVYRLWDEDGNYHADWTQDTMDANARLIEASPSLLAALRWIADHGDTGAGGRPAFHDMRDHARKAINLAERGRP